MHEQIEARVVMKNQIQKKIQTMQEQQDQVTKIHNNKLTKNNKA
jgi:hypothetical protein